MKTTKTTFKKLAAAKGKGAAIAAYQNKLKAEHNGPTAHAGPSGMHYGAHSSHQAITSQAGCCKGC